MLGQDARDPPAGFATNIIGVAARANGSDARDRGGSEVVASAGRRAPTRSGGRPSAHEEGRSSCRTDRRPAAQNSRRISRAVWRAAPSGILHSGTLLFRHFGPSLAAARGRFGLSAAAASARPRSPPASSSRAAAARRRDRGRSGGDASPLAGRPPGFAERAAAYSASPCWRVRRRDAALFRRRPSAS